MRVAARFQNMKHKWVEEKENSLKLMRELRGKLLLEMSQGMKTGQNTDELRSALLNNDLAILREEARVKEQISSKLRNRIE
jgi:hypothetical protein